MRMLAAFLLCLATPAWAAPGTPAVEQHEPAYGDAEHSDTHEGSHFGLYTADNDGDGTPNWRDSTNGAEAADPDADHYSLRSIIFHAINLSILMGILVWFGRRPIGDALATRALGIRKEIAESARLRDEAEQRNRELTQRLDKIETEIQGMRDKAVEDAAAEEAKLIERANLESERIKATAERSIRDEVTRARASLRADAVKLAVKLAETTLKDRADAGTQQRLAKDFLDSIKQGGMNRV